MNKDYKANLKEGKNELIPEFKKNQIGPIGPCWSHIGLPPSKFRNQDDWRASSLAIRNRKSIVRVVIYWEHLCSYEPKPNSLKCFFRSLKNPTRLTWMFYNFYYEHEGDCPNSDAKHFDTQLTIKLRKVKTELFNITNAEASIQP